MERKVCTAEVFGQTTNALICRVGLCLFDVIIFYRYSRIFSIGSHGITTYNCNTLEITNRWPYEDVISIRALQQPHEFTITMRKGKDKKQDTMRFSTVHRSHLLSDALRFRHLFAEKRYEVHVRNMWSIPYILNGCIRRTRNYLKNAF